MKLNCTGREVFPKSNQHGDMGNVYLYLYGCLMGIKWLNSFDFSGCQGGKKWRKSQEDFINTLGMSCAKLKLNWSYNWSCNQSKSKLRYTFPDSGQQTDGWVEVIVMLSQLLDVVVVVDGADLENTCVNSMIVQILSLSIYIFQYTKYKYSVLQHKLVQWAQ